MSTKSSPGFWKAIALTGFIAGTLDIAAACLMYFMSSGKGPMNVLLYIASGVVGTSAFTAGWAMALLGLLLHFVIAYSFTVLLFLLYPKISGFIKNDFVLALLFGMVIWTIMNLVVLPLSGVPKSEFNLVSAIKGALVLVLAVGLPISLSARKYYTTA